MKDFRHRKSSGVKKFIWLFFLPFIILVIAYFVYKIFLIPEPVIHGLDAFKYLPIDKTLTIEGKNIQSIDISIRQDETQRSLLKDIPDYSEKTYTLSISPKELHLKDGTATVIVKAKSSLFKGVKYEINSIIDTIPPTIWVLNAPYQIYQGGGGFAILRAKEADSVFIRLEDRKFRAFLIPNQEDTGASMSHGSKTYFVFFPAPYDTKEGGIFYAVAQDEAGNQDIKALSTKLRMKNYRTSTIEVDDSFINRVVLPMLNDVNASDPEKAFKTVNEEWRKKSLERLHEISKETMSEIFWKGPFLQLKNSKVMATYGDRRTYYYRDKMIGESVHLGYDLASVSNALVEAANTGVVRFVGELGIYGNTIIIDHGMGLMSLYGHLSETMVREGEAVKKGAVIGRTGATGFAGGDHLHFGILIHGYEVSPLYWWDQHWLKVNIFDRLEEYYAGIRQK